MKANKPLTRQILLFVGLWMSADRRSKEIIEESYSAPNYNWDFLAGKNDNLLLILAMGYGLL